MHVECFCRAYVCFLMLLFRSDDNVRRNAQTLFDKCQVDERSVVGLGSVPLVRRE